MSLRIASLGLLAALPLLASACGDDPSPLQAELAWRVVCGDAQGCVNGIARTILAIDGEKDHAVACDITDTGDTYTVSMSATKKGDAGYGLGIRNAVFPKGGGPVTNTSCAITMTDGVNTYEGDCSGGTPSEPVPCQVTDLSVDDGDDGPEITGTVFCEAIPLLSAPLDANRKRNIVGPTGSGPAGVRFVNCRGL
jgi:hypothetical protein